MCVEWIRATGCMWFGWIRENADAHTPGAGTWRFSGVRTGSGPNRSRPECKPRLDEPAWAPGAARFSLFAKRQKGSNQVRRTFQSSDTPRVAPVSLLRFRTVERMGLCESKNKKGVCQSVPKTTERDREPVGLAHLAHRTNLARGSRLWDLLRKFARLQATTRSLTTRKVTFWKRSETKTEQTRRLPLQLLRTVV